MRVQANLGVTKAKDLRAPDECFSFGKRMTQLLDSIVFAEFYFRKPEKPLTKGELDNVSIAVNSSGAVADKLKSSKLPDDLKNRARKYSSSANRLNKKILNFLVLKGSPPLKGFTAEDQKSVENGVRKLRIKADDLSR